MGSGKAPPSSIGGRGGKAGGDGGGGGGGVVGVGVVVLMVLVGLRPVVTNNDNSIFN